MPGLSLYALRSISCSFSTLFYTVGLTPADCVSVSQAPSLAWLASGFRRPWWRLEGGRKGGDRVFLPLVWYFHQDLPFLGFWLLPHSLMIFQVDSPLGSVTITSSFIPNPVVAVASCWC